MAAGRQPRGARATPARPAAARATAAGGAAGTPAGTVAGTVATPGEPRRPQQERGQRRVEAILDATSAIVAEEGAPAVTMHAIARRSGTTIGSLYHFFPDRDAVFAALLDRHATRFGEGLAPLESVDWSALSVERSVERFLAAALGYIGDNPDLLPVAHVLHAEHPKRPRHEGPEQMLQRVVAAIVAAHAPRAASGARAAHVAMILAAVEGAVERGHRIPQPGPVVMQRELKRMLCTYIESLG